MSAATHTPTHTQQTVPLQRVGRCAHTCTNSQSTCVFSVLILAILFHTHAKVKTQEAFDAGCAPPVVLEATHHNVLEYGITLAQLQQHALAPNA
jgi:hypothetical protein